MSMEPESVKVVLGSLLGKPTMFVWYGKSLFLGLILAYLNLMLHLSPIGSKTEN